MGWLIYVAGFWLTAMFMRHLKVGFKENPQPVPFGGFAIRDVTPIGWVLLVCWPAPLLVLFACWITRGQER
jgi:hypothetical protein